MDCRSARGSRTSEGGLSDDGMDGLRVAEERTVNGGEPRQLENTLIGLFLLPPLKS